MPLDIPRIQALCFDVDGTLSDTDDLYVRWLGSRLQPFAWLLPQRDPTPFARSLVMAMETPGNFIYHLLDRLRIDDPLFRFLSWSKARLGSSKASTYQIIPGVEPVLALLTKHYPLAVVSARGEKSTRAFLDHFHLSGYFRAIVTAHTCRHTKPYPDPIIWAARQMNVPPENCLMIGDTTVDIQAGRAAGAQTLGVLCGFGKETELREAGADAILASPALAAVLLLQESSGDLHPL